jgi:hypothetical protein
MFIFNIIVLFFVIIGLLFTKKVVENIVNLEYSHKGWKELNECCKDGEECYDKPQFLQGDEEKCKERKEKSRENLMKHYDLLYPKDNPPKNNPALRLNRGL